MRPGPSSFVARVSAAWKRRGSREVEEVPGEGPRQAGGPCEGEGSAKEGSEKS